MVSETVWIADGSARAVYHESEKCGRLTGATSHEAIRSSLEDEKWRGCPLCTDQIAEPDGHGDWSAQQALAEAEPGDLS